MLGPDRVRPDELELAHVHDEVLGRAAPVVPTVAGPCAPAEPVGPSRRRQRHLAIAIKGLAMMFVHAD